MADELVCFGQSKLMSTLVPSALRTTTAAWTAKVLSEAQVDTLLPLYFKKSVDYAPLDHMPWLHALLVHCGA